MNKPIKSNMQSTFKDKRVDIDMTKDQLISELEERTDYDYIYLKTLSREKLQEMYEERA